MAQTRVNIDTSGDRATRQLARGLLACEILTEAMTAFMIFRFVDHTNVTYRLSWRLRKYREEVDAKRKAERDLRIDVGRVLFEAERVLHG